MELNEFTVKLSLLGLPGIICFFIYQRLTGKRNRTVFDGFLMIFLFSILSYVVYGFFDAILNFLQNEEFNTEVIDVVYYSSKKVEWVFLAYAAISGVLSAYLLAYGHRFKLLNLIGQKIGATNRYGDEDVWDYFHNLPASEKNDNWVIVRDHKTGLDYYGYVSTWSDPGNKRELIVSDASVSKDGAHLYEAKQVYFSRKDEDISIEVITKDNVEQESEVE